MPTGPNWTSLPQRLALLAALALVGPRLAAAQVPAPAPVSEARTVRPSEIVVLSGSVFRIGDDRYQVAGVRTPRPRFGQCLLERRKGREARATLRRLLRRGDIRLIPTGAVGPRGERIVRVLADRQDVAQRLIERRVAVPRQAGEGRNPWCLSMR